jgi:hypothetical protein
MSQTMAVHRVDIEPFLILKPGRCGAMIAVTNVAINLGLTHVIHFNLRSWPAHLSNIRGNVNTENAFRPTRDYWKKF